MKRLVLAAALALPAIALSGCAGYYGGGGFYDSGPVAYDGYYDGFYGPIYDGYWGDDGGFYYRGHGNDHRFRRGDPGHFARQPGGSNFQAMHGNFQPGRGMSMPHFGGGGGMHGGGGHGGHH